jgi:hypothetical protein
MIAFSRWVAGRRVKRACLIYSYVSFLPLVFVLHPVCRAQVCRSDGDCFALQLMILLYFVVVSSVYCHSLINTMIEYAFMSYLLYVIYAQNIHNSNM